MRKLLVVPFAAVAAIGLAACAESPMETVAPQFELVDPTQRLDASDVNAHVYGSFALNFTEVVGTPGGWGVIRSGAANFPGNPKNAGTCDDGLWINPQGKRTSGTLDRPHPHCVGQTEGQSEVPVVVVLEPISARNRQPGGSSENLQFATSRPDGDVRIQGGSPVDTEGRGTIVAYAIDAATLNDVSPRRVGVLTINLTQYTTVNTNYFLDDCTLDVNESYARCLNKVISATYAPLPGSAGVGVATQNVTGMLYWTSASSPFNYSD